MNAKETIVRASPNIGPVNLREAITKSRSPSCAQIRATATITELYIAMALLMVNMWNMWCSRKVAMPLCGSESLFPPGTVKPAAKVTVATSVATNNRVLTLSL